ARLAGPKLALSEPREQISSGVCCGTIQVPASGQPIVLLFDCQSVGGYPRIATVVAVDRARLAQLRPGDAGRFQEVSIGEAHTLYLARERDLSRLVLGLEKQFA